jgi:hypothetical protein
MWSWLPQGPGCIAVAALLRDKDALRRTWCKRFAASSVLFVGDSTQGQLFLSFAHLIGVGSAVSRMSQCALRKFSTEPRELNVTAQLCGGTGAVTARFLRNELLRIGPNQAGVVTDAKNGDHWLCDFESAAREAHLIILNRGQHYVPDMEFKRTLADTLAVLQQLSPGATIVYRSTWSNFEGCAQLPDPLPLPYEYSGRGSQVDEWRLIQEQNQLAREVVERAGALWLNIYQSSAYRPGGHQRAARARFCSHYCLPGPVDDWSMLLMALTLSER